MHAGAPFKPRSAPPVTQLRRQINKHARTKHSHAPVVMTTRWTPCSWGVLLRSGESEPGNPSSAAVPGTKGGVAPGPRAEEAPWTGPLDLEDLEEPPLTARCSNRGDFVELQHLLKFRKDSSPSRGHVALPLLRSLSALVYQI